MLLSRSSLKAFEYFAHKNCQNGPDTVHMNSGPGSIYCKPGFNIYTRTTAYQETYAWWLYDWESLEASQPTWDSSLGSSCKWFIWTLLPIPLFFFYLKRSPNLLYRSCTVLTKALIGNFVTMYRYTQCSLHRKNKLCCCRQRSVGFPCFISIT